MSAKRVLIAAERATIDKRDITIKKWIVAISGSTNYLTSSAKSQRERDAENVEIHNHSWNYGN